ncbi:MoaF C-terminal domain-containing protein [Streptomyces sp. NPDC057253]|uniref:MoaF C-terminal domain-containing protein n=1 Tax=Streptomyces sp. NPDC057253 TaxID=3346069 RepID=UPI0036280307
MSTPSDLDADAGSLGLGDTFLTNRPAPSEALHGRRLVIALDDGAKVVVDLREPSAAVDSSGGSAVRPVHRYEVFQVAPDLFFLRREAITEGKTSRSALLDLRDGRALVVDSTVAGTKTPGQPKVGQRFRHGALSGSRDTGRFERSRELVGRRIMWTYSPTDVYEHIYLNEDWYVWHCLAGEEFRLAEVDPCVMFKVRDDIHVLGFGERVLPIAAVMVLNLATMQSYASMLGEEEDGSLNAFSFGARGTAISNSWFPEPYDPRTAALADADHPGDPRELRH